MPIDKRPNAEPIRGYRLIEKLGAGGFGEVWKCEAPGGIHKAIKFVYGNVNGLAAAHAEEELRAVQHIKSIRHPFLLSMDRVECVAGELIIVTELADQNLFDLWEKYRARGAAGVPRDELLGYLREAAEVLDLLDQKFDLQHLDVKPHNLFLVSGHVKVADFGLVNSLAGAADVDAKLSSGAVTPLYAAPELFQGRLSRQCDQYSLALVFMELLTGALPFAGKNTRQLLLQHTTAEPDLSPLPEADRAVVARALAKNPEHRYPSCLDLVRALQAGRPVGSASEAEVQLAPTSPQASTDTVVLGKNVDTQRVRPAAAPALPPGVLGDYRFLERIANGELMEVWRAQAPDGRRRLVQLLYGFKSDEKKLGDAVRRLQTVQHPALLAAEVAHVGPGRLVLVTDAARETVRDRFNQCQARKQPGVPRRELIDDLRAAAEVLDYLYLQHGVQHLGLSPRHLVLDHGWLQLAEFGYAQILWLPEDQDVARRGARYAAPELFRGQPGRHCDQYSLALIYAEMLTGTHPFRGQSAEAYLRSGKKPELDGLPELDRSVIARALNADPQARWPSSSEMLLALEGITPEQHVEVEATRDSFAALLDGTRDARRVSAYTGLSAEETTRAVADIIRAAGGEAALDAIVPEVSPTDGVLTYRFQAGLPLGKAKIQLEAFSREVGARVESQDESGGVMAVELPGTFWQQWRGRRPGVEVRVQMARVNLMSTTPIDVTVTISARNAKDPRGLVERTGPGLLEALQKYLLINSEKRIKDRLLWPEPLTVVPVYPDGRQDDPIACRGKDLSQTGVGFFLPHELTTPDVLVQLPAPGGTVVTIPATLIRTKRGSDGWYEVGAIFRLPARRPSLADICLETVTV